MEQSKGKTRKEAEGKQKYEKIMRETFGKKNYITKNKVGEVRNIFKARVLIKTRLLSVTSILFLDNQFFTLITWIQFKIHDVSLTLIG